MHSRRAFFVRCPGETDARRAYDYILLDNIPFFKEKLKYIIPAIKAYPKRFTVIHTTEAPKTYVIKINRNGP